MSVFYQRNTTRRKKEMKQQTMREMKDGELAKGYCQICSPAFPCRGCIDLYSFGSASLSAYQILPKVDSGRYLISVMLGVFAIWGAVLL